MAERHAVTGAFGYSGRYIARRLLEAEHEVVTLTNTSSPDGEFGGRVGVQPLCFDEPRRLVDALQEVKVLYNTYWVRFNHRTFTHEEAVRNSLVLFKAARAAGVERIVHVSITNPSEDSPLEYFSGKARLERALRESDLSWAILRPAVLFGREDILINNIAWALRRLPVFGLFGDGSYRLQPIYVDDLAKLAVHHGRQRENVVVDAIGPETFTYRELVEAIGDIISRRKPIVAAPPALGYWAGRMIGRLVGDVMITREEIRGLMDDLLYVESTPAGETKLTDWARRNVGTLGRRYASELGRRQTGRFSRYSTPVTLKV
jgi:nucleoside-diphosphate-sugar epimerase